MSRICSLLAALVVSVVLSVLGSEVAFADIRIWDGGGTDANWTNADNWVGNVAPAAGDFLTFSDGAAQFTAHNDFPSNTTFNVIFLSSGSEYTLTGSAIQLSGTITATNTTGTHTVGLAITLTADQTWSSAAGGTVAFSSSVVLNGKVLEIDSAGTIAMNGVVGFGAGAVTKTGAGVLVLSGNNNYTGSTTVSAGTLRTAGVGTLGLPTVGTTVGNGATLELAGSVSSSEPLTLNGPGVGGAGALQNSGAAKTWSGPITLASTATVGVSGSQLTLSSPVTGPGGLSKVGTGTLRFTGSGANSYAGGTTINAGTLLLEKAIGVAAIPGDVAVGDGVNTSTLRLGNGSQIADAAAVTVASLAGFDLNGQAEGIGSLAGNGVVTLTSASASGTLTVGFNGLSTTFSGSITVGPGTGGALIKLGAGMLVLSGNNSYQGQTTVEGGTLKITNQNALGAGPAGTTVQAGATLEIEGAGATFMTKPLTLNGVGVGAGGALKTGDGVDRTWSGPVTLASAASVGVSGAGNLALSGAIGGTGGLTKVGSGLLQLSGASPNTYAGPTMINAGTMVLGKGGSVTAIPGDVTIGDGVGGPNADTLRLANTNQIADMAAVTVATSGLFDLHGLPETIGSLAGAGSVNNLLLVNSVSFFTVGANSTSTTFSGSIQDSGVGVAIIQFVKVGTGTLTLSGTSTHSGATTIQAGAVRVDGSLANSTVNVQGGTLGGSGNVKGISGSSGAVSPGSSPGVLSSTAGVVLSGKSFVVELNGPTPGGGYDQLVAAGTLSLDNGTLNATLGFVPTAGATFTIIQKSSAGPVSSTFNGLPEGASLTISGQPFLISYQGGDGNDVVLTFLQLVVCSPRPPLNVQATNQGNGTLRVDLAANQNISITPNLIQSLTFTKLTNAAITINGNPVQVNVPITISPAMTFQFFVQRAPGGQGQATTAEFQVQDSCQTPWPTFVGGGPSAF